MIIEESVGYRIAYQLKETEQILGYSEMYDTRHIASEMMKNRNRSTDDIYAFIIKETLKREMIK